VLDCRRRSTAVVIAATRPLLAMEPAVRWRTSRASTMKMTSSAMLVA